MAGIPRVITVDPGAVIARLVRAAVDLSDIPAVQVDARGSREALDEIKRGGYALLVATLHVDRHMTGFDLAMRARKLSPDTAVVILANDDDDDLDDATRAEVPFIYLRRPVDPFQFVRVLVAGLNGDDIFTAAYSDAPLAAHNGNAWDGIDLGPVPPLDLKAAQGIVDRLLRDVGAMAVVLTTRTGDVLLDRGAASYLDRDRLSAALMPLVQTQVAMIDIVGGYPSGLQYIDGETYDLFVLPLGFHHFLTLVFDGQMGSRQFGAVTRFGRRSAEDLKALLGASAYLFELPAAEPEVVYEQAAEPIAPIEPLIASEWVDDTLPEPEPEPLELEPLGDFDPRILDQKVTDAQADALFDPDQLARIASENRRGRGPLSYEEARELGIVP